MFLSVGLRFLPIIFLIFNSNIVIVIFIAKLCENMHCIFIYVYIYTEYNVLYYNTEYNWYWWNKI